MPIEYTIRKSTRARHLRLTIHIDGRVVVTQPRRASDAAVQRFVEEYKDWIIRKTTAINRRPDTPLNRHSRADYLKYREDARALIRERIAFFNSFYKFTIGNISIKNHTSRWGSCSRKGNLNFNYKVLFLSPAARDYIVVHELCHLAELNHSERFWDLVRLQAPDFQTIRKALRQDVA